MGLHARTENRQHPGLAAREEIGRHRRDGRGAHLGDQPAVHGHERLAGFRAKEHDHGVMRRQTSVVRVKGHQLGAERAPRRA